MIILFTLDMKDDYGKFETKSPYFFINNCITCFAKMVTRHDIGMNGEVFPESLSFLSKELFINLCFSILFNSTLAATR